MFTPDWRDDPTLWARPADLPPRPPRLSSGVHGNARLANRRDLAGLLPGPGALSFADATALVEDAADGSGLACLPGLHLPADLRERHVLAVGTTGCGKTQKLILPQLAADVADPGRAVIALDAKGGVLPGYVAALAARHRPARPVRVINFKSPARTTHAWNPAAAIATRTEALEIAHAVCTNAEGGNGEGRTNEAFWLWSSVNLLADVLRLLADDPRESGSLARAKQLIDDSAYDLAKAAEGHPHAKELERRYPALRRYLEGSGHVTQQSVIADCAMRLTLFGDEQVACTTSGPCELDLRGLIREGGILVLEVPEAHAKQLTPLTNLFVSRVLAALLEEAMDAPGGRLARPCSLILDELGSACGKLPEFETRLATLRSRGVAITGAVQSLKQLEHLYGAAASVADGFSTKLFFGGGLSAADARFASDLSGVCTVAAESTTVSRAPGGRTTRSRTRSPAARAVLLADEVSRPAVHPLLGVPLTAFTPAAPPFYAYLTAAYERPDLAAALRAKEPRVERAEEPPQATVSGDERLSLLKRVQANRVYLLRGKDRGREAWYYVLVNKRPAVVFEKELKAETVNLTAYGEVLLSGWGKDPPPEAARRAKEEWGYQGGE